MWQEQGNCYFYNRFKPLSIQNTHFMTLYLHTVEEQAIYKRTARMPSSVHSNPSGWAGEAGTAPLSPFWHRTQAPAVLQSTAPCHSFFFCGTAGTKAPLPSLPAGSWVVSLSPSPVEHLPHAVPEGGHGCLQSLQLPCKPGWGGPFLEQQLHSLHCPLHRAHCCLVLLLRRGVTGSFGHRLQM